jgi:hypothetical protein
MRNFSCTLCPASPDDSNDDEPPEPCHCTATCAQPPVCQKACRGKLGEAAVGIAWGGWGDIDVVAHDREAFLRGVPRHGLARRRVHHLDDQRTTRLHVRIHLPQPKPLPKPSPEESTDEAQTMGDGGAAYVEGAGPSG